MSKQHAAAPLDVVTLWLLCAGKKPVAIVYAFFRVCDVVISHNM